MEAFYAFLSFVLDYRMTTPQCSCCHLTTRELDSFLLLKTVQKSNDNVIFLHIIMTFPSLHFF